VVVRTSVPASGLHPGRSGGGALALSPTPAVLLAAEVLAGFAIEQFSSSVRDLQPEPTPG